MPVRKFRSVAEMPGPSLGQRLDPENLRQAFGLATLAQGLRPVKKRPGLQKCRSWNDRLLTRERERVSRSPLSP